MIIYLQVENLDRLSLKQPKLSTQMACLDMSCYEKLFSKKTICSKMCFRKKFHINNLENLNTITEHGVPITI